MSYQNTQQPILSRDSNGRFKKGTRNSIPTEFKNGQHWRSPKPWWEKQWLENEYVGKQRSAADIASEYGITETSIYFWLKKHGIPRRSVSEAREIKKWGLTGEQNPMFGKFDKLNPHWKGGIAPERQKLYSRTTWKELEKSIRDRDGLVCARCGKMCTGTKQMHLHHIKSFQDFPEKRFDINNIVTLCSKCHGWVHSKKNVYHEFL